MRHITLLRSDGLDRRRQFEWQTSACLRFTREYVQKSAIVDSEVGVERRNLVLNFCENRRPIHVDAHNHRSCATLQQSIVRCIAWLKLQSSFMLPLTKEITRMQVFERCSGTDDCDISLVR